MAQRFPKKARREDHGDPGLDFDNTGQRQLLVPGFGGTRVPIERPAAERFAHGFGDWSQSRLTAREIAMLQLMNTITDRPNWNVDIHDPAVVAHWASEAFALELISPAAWDWCVTELRDKALYHDKFHLTHVFDSASRICKSDQLISEELLHKLAGEVEALASAPEFLHQYDGAQHGRPEGETQVALVDPDMFSLAFGETRVLNNAALTSSVTAAHQMGRGGRSPEQSWSCSRSPWGRCDRNPTRGMQGVPRGLEECAICRHSGSSPEQPWQKRAFMFSPRYQWLPAEVGFRPAGTRADGVTLTSYINNLHPRQSFSLYRSIETIIAASIQPWNEILVRPGKGRTPERIRTYGVQWSPQEPTTTDLEELDEIMQAGQGDIYQATKAWLHEFLAQPDNPRAPPPSWQYPLIQPDWDTTYSPSAALKLKYRRCKKWLHPEPGVAFTYDEWKAGKNNHAIVPGRMLHWRKLTDLPPKEDHAFYTVSLETEFAEQGLQVVVEMGAVELTAEQPCREATVWQLTGLLGEHIVATTLVYFASENVTYASGAISFRVEAELDPIAHVWGTGTGSNPHHALAPLADIYGLDSHLDLASDSGDDENRPGAPALQELGTVATPDGRLVAFPNVAQHRVSAFHLLDPSKPGRRRFLKVHLVDPHYRLCSTRNAPPQQPGWWSEAGWARIDWRARRMPPELVQSIAALVGDVAPSAAEAVRRRDEFRAERQSKQQQVFDEEVAAYRGWYTFTNGNAESMADRTGFRDSCSSLTVSASSTAPYSDVWLWHSHEHRRANNPYCQASSDVVPRPFFTPAIALVAQLPPTAGAPDRQHPELITGDAVRIAREEANAILNSSVMRDTARAVAAKTRFASRTIKRYIATSSNQPPPGTLVSRGLHECHGPWCLDVPKHSAGACFVALSSWMYSLHLSDKPDVHRRCVAMSYVGIAEDAPEIGALGIVGKDAYSGYEMFHETVELCKYVAVSLAECSSPNEDHPSEPPVVGTLEYLDYRMADSVGFCYVLIYAAHSSPETIPRLLTELTPYRHDPVQSLFCAVNDVASLPYDLAHGEPNYFTACTSTVDIGHVCNHLSAALHECADLYAATTHQWYARSIIASLFQQVVDPRYAVAVNSRGSVNRVVLQCEDGCSATSLCEPVVRWLGFGEASQLLEAVLGKARATVDGLCPALLPIIYGQGNWPYDGLEELPRLDLASEWLNMASATFVLSLLATDGALGKVATAVPTMFL